MHRRELKSTTFLPSARNYFASRCFRLHLFGRFYFSFLAKKEITSVEGNACPCGADLPIRIHKQEEHNMALHELDNTALDGNYAKSYATEANLRKRLTEDADMYPEYHDRVIVVRTPAGRWTALVMLDRSQGGYIGRYEGFMKV
jgi:hypothetical protein